VKFLLDMNLSPVWVGLLTIAEHDAVHWSDIGAPGAHDEILVKHARSQKMVLMTADTDFESVLLQHRWDRPSVVRIRGIGQQLPKTSGRVVLAAIRACREELQAGAVLSVEPALPRATLLQL